MTVSTLLDLRGKGCADTLMRLARVARDCAGQEHDVVVWSDDRGATTELPAWCRMTNHHYVGPIKDELDRYLITLFPTSSASAISPKDE
jgi:TusA-related sulfurtransferase